LIENHKNEEHLVKLNACHIDTIPDWAQRVQEQFKKLDSLLIVLDEDIPKLEMVIKYEPHMWGSRIRDMSLGMILAGFHHAEENMEEFRLASIFEREHLRAILEDLRDIEEIIE